MFKAPKYSSTGLRPAFVFIRMLGVIVLMLWTGTTVYSISPELSYFIGIWTIAVKDSPKAAISWTVKEDMGGDWLSGTVDRDGDRTSVDHWRMNGKNIERHIFTSDGLYIRMNATGWKAGKLSFAGIASGKDGDFRMREMITRESDTRFRAVWEKQGADGVWTVFSDETCTK